MEGQHRGHREAREQRETSIKKLEGRLGRLEDAEARAYGGYVRGLASEQPCRRVVAGLRAERTWVQEELERQRRELERAQQALIDTEAITRIYPQLVERISGADFEGRCSGVFGRRRDSI